MRSHILTALAVSSLAIAATAAQAADLPSRRVAPMYVPPPIPVFTWTGFFIGGNAGAAFNDSNASHSYYFPAGSIAGSSGSAGTLTTNGAGNNNVGFTGGGQIGYNYEFGGAGPGVPGLGGLGFGGGGIVLGIVADAQYLEQRNNYGSNYTFAPNTPLTYGNAFVPVRGVPATNLVTNAGGQDNFFGTVRGRLGVAFDRVLLYGTGGFAYNTHTTGYTFGGGLEYSITNNVSIGAEYLRVNMDRGLTETATYVAPARPTAAGTLYLTSTGGRDEFNVARAFLNYRFTYAVAAPVVARY